MSDEIFVVGRCCVFCNILVNVCSIVGKDVWCSMEGCGDCLHVSGWCLVGGLRWHTGNGICPVVCMGDSKTWLGWVLVSGGAIFV